MTSLRFHPCFKPIKTEFPVKEDKPTWRPESCLWEKRKPLSS